MDANVLAVNIKINDNFNVTVEFCCIEFGTHAVFLLCYEWLEILFTYTVVYVRVRKQYNTTGHIRM